VPQTIPKEPFANVVSLDQHALPFYQYSNVIILATFISPVLTIRNQSHDGNMTTFYRNVAKGLKHDQVWFPIQYGDNSRYVHVGNVSDGCATVVDLNAWAAICDALISHRSADGRYVGLLIVKGKPERAK
jgi:hypothetical protein